MPFTIVLLPFNNLIIVTFFEYQPILTYFQASPFVSSAPRICAGRKNGDVIGNA